MKINQDIVPSTIDQAVNEIVNNVDDEDRNNIQEGVSYHFTVGRTLRNSWSLWDNDSPIKRNAVDEYGIAHADDISGLILAWAPAKIRGDVFDPHVYVKKYYDHWKSYGTTPLKAGGWPPENLS